MRKKAFYLYCTMSLVKEIQHARTHVNVCLLSSLEIHKKGIKMYNEE